MVMLRPSGKATKIAKKVMGEKGVKVRDPKSSQPKQMTTPYLQH